MATTEVVLRDDDRWASCSIEEFGSPGRERHIVKRGGLTTVCGTSASHSSIWRANKTKPRCQRCLQAYSST